jgi:hypothetical protein
MAVENDNPEIIPIAEKTSPEITLSVYRLSKFQEEFELQLEPEPKDLDLFERPEYNNTLDNEKHVRR